MISPTFTRETQGVAAKHPFGVSDRIAGHNFPPTPGLSDAERIAALEDAVRGLHAAILYVASGVQGLTR